MDRINAVRRDSIITQAAKEICRFIESRGMGVGERLPAEVPLAQMLGISRNSLREALRVLDGLGFIEKRPDRGIVVKGSLEGSSQKPDNLNAHRAIVAAAAPVAFQARAIVEGRCAELAVHSATEDEIESIGIHLKRFREAFEAGDYVTSSQEHLAFHDAIVGAAHNPVLASIYYQVRFVTSEIGQMGAPKLYKSPQLLPVHAEIFEAFKQRDDKRLLSAMAAHFKAIHKFVEFMSSNKGAADVVLRRLGPGRRSRPRKQGKD